jgi:hypothetical protein
MREMKNRVEDIHNCMKSTDNYLEKYQPFNAFCQLFEVLRMALLPEQIAKVQQYEEYRLKLLYEIILQDEGRPLTNFDKKYAIEPAGYTFDFLKDTKSLPKLNAKSRRFILNRPSFTSALRPNGSE